MYTWPNVLHIPVTQLELKSCEVNRHADSKANFCQLEVHLFLLLYKFKEWPREITCVSLSVRLSNTSAHGLATRLQLCSRLRHPAWHPCGMETEPSFALKPRLKPCCCGHSKRVYSSSLVPHRIVFERQRAALKCSRPKCREFSSRALITTVTTFCTGCCQTNAGLTVTSLCPCICTSYE